MESNSRGHEALVFSLLIFFLLLVFPFSSAHATGSIGNRVANFCAPQPTVPNVNGSCSACHTTINNRSNNDLNAAGIASRSSATYSFFCPVSTPAPTPTPTPLPSPPSPPPSGISGGTGSGGGSGMSSRSGSRGGMSWGKRKWRRGDDDDDDRRSWRSRDRDDDDDRRSRRSRDRDRDDD